MCTFKQKMMEAHPAALVCLCAGWPDWQSGGEYNIISHSFFQPLQIEPASQGEEGGQTKDREEEETAEEQ